MARAAPERRRDGLRVLRLVFGLGLEVRDHAPASGSRPGARRSAASRGARAAVARPRAAGARCPGRRLSFGSPLGGQSAAARRRRSAVRRARRCRAVRSSTLRPRSVSSDATTPAVPAASSGSPACSPAVCDGSRPACRSRKRLHLLLVRDQAVARLGELRSRNSLVESACMPRRREFSAMNQLASCSVTRCAICGIAVGEDQAERVGVGEPRGPRPRAARPRNSIVLAHRRDDVLHRHRLALRGVEIELVISSSSRVRLMICCEIDFSRSSRSVVTVERT